MRVGKEELVELRVPERQGNKPLAEEAVDLCRQLALPGSNFVDFYPAFTRLGKELLGHATRNGPIDFGAFLRTREGARVYGVRGGGGSVLGWIFRGEVDTEVGKARVEGERTDSWSGWGGYSFGESYLRR